MAVRAEVVGYREPGTDTALAHVFIDGTEIGSVTLSTDDPDYSIDEDLSVTADNGVVRVGGLVADLHAPLDIDPNAEIRTEMTIVDPGRGWLLSEWRDNRDEWAASASEAAAALIRQFHDQGEHTAHVREYV